MSNFEQSIGFSLRRALVLAMCRVVRLPGRMFGQPQAAGEMIECGVNHHA